MGLLLCALVTFLMPQLFQSPKCFLVKDVVEVTGLKAEQFQLWSLKAFELAPPAFTSLRNADLRHARTNLAAREWFDKLAATSFGERWGIEITAVAETDARAATLARTITRCYSRIFSL